MNIVLGIVGAAIASAILSFFGIVLGVQSRNVMVHHRS